MFGCRTECIIVVLDSRGSIARGGAIEWRTDLVLSEISTTLQYGVASVSVQWQQSKEGHYLLRRTVFTEAMVDPAWSVTVHEVSLGDDPELSTKNV